MKILLLSDLHGNLTATMAMEREIREIRPDRVFFLGDAVGKGPRNDQTCDWVREHCDLAIGGNWDYGVGGKEFPADGFFWEQLGEERLQWLRELPNEAEFSISGFRFRLIHGRPLTSLIKGDATDDEMVETCRLLNGEETDGLIFGDSHRPFIRTAKGKMIINTGSIGNNLGGIPRASAVLLEGTEKGNQSCSLRTTMISLPYDNKGEAEVAEAMVDLPKKDSYIREVLTGYYSR